MTKAMNYSSSFLNPVIYALRIPEFRHMLGFFRYRRQGAIQREGNHRRYNRAAASTLQHMTNVSHARARHTFSVILSYWCVSQSCISPIKVNADFIRSI